MVQDESAKTANYNALIISVEKRMTGSLSARWVDFAGRNAWMKHTE